MTSGDTTTVRVTVRNAKLVTSKTVFAMVEVGVQNEDIKFGILGIQARHRYTS